MGIVGIAILVWPKITHRDALGTMQLLGSISLLFSSISWAVGSVLSRKWQMKVDPLVATGWEMIFASLGHSMLALRHRSISPRDLQPSRRDGRAVPGRLRIVDRLHRVCLAAEARADAEGRDVRVRESDRRCDSWDGSCCTSASIIHAGGTQSSSLRPSRW